MDYTLYCISFSAVSSRHLAETRKMWYTIPMTHSPSSIPENSAPIPEWAELKKQLKLLQEETLLWKKIQEIGKKILQAGKFQTNYTIQVYQDRGMEVLHAANGTILLPTGLLRLAKTDANIAFIISHEIAHWENKDYYEDRARIPHSPWDMKESECRADESGIELYKKAGYSMASLNKFFISILPYRPHQESCPDVYEIDGK